MAASRTTNPLLLLLVLAVLGVAVAERRVPGPWSRSFVVFLQVGLVVIGLRVVFSMLFAPAGVGPVLFTLPEVLLPDWLAGVRLGGPVTGDTLLGAVYEGLRLAVILACFGAANSLVVPSRLLRVVPAALYEIGVAVVISLTVLPMLVADLGRVSEARLLRGRSSGRLRGSVEMVVPVLSGSLDRAVHLAASMDSRGYGRADGASRSARRTTSAAVLVGLAGMTLGVYGLLDGGAPGVAGVPLLGWPMLVLGGGVALGAGLLAGRGVTRTVYRPDPWRAPEWAVLATGVAAVGVVLLAASNGVDLQGQTSPPVWPSLPLLPALGVLLALVAVPVSPPMPRVRASRRASTGGPR